GQWRCRAFRLTLRIGIRRLCGGVVGSRVGGRRLADVSLSAAASTRTRETSKLRGGAACEPSRGREAWGREAVVEWCVGGAECPSSQFVRRDYKGVKCNVKTMTGGTATE